MFPDFLFSDKININKKSVCKGGEDVMLIRYNKLDDYSRDRIRFLENKGHVGYIRYLLMRRIPLSQISSELLRLGLSGAEEEDYLLYFEKALYPVIQKYKLTSFYRSYLKDKEKERLSFTTTFKKSEVSRKAFCECIKDMEIDHFFSREIVNYYNGAANVPLIEETNEPIIMTEKVPDWTEMLNHPKRHVIDGMLVDGKTSKMIASYLDEKYDVQMPPAFIGMYAKAFFRVQRRDLERTIDDLSTEKEKLEQSLKVIKEADEIQMTIGEKSAAIATTKTKISQLDTQIKKLSGHYSEAAYNEGVLEFAQMREMFADVMVRTHKRFVIIDDRNDDDGIGNLNTIVSMMGKATDKILSLENTMKDNSKKTIVEEMLEVTIPSLERIEEEERQAKEEYKEILYAHANDDDEDDDEIIGMDE